MIIRVRRVEHAITKLEAGDNRATLAPLYGGQWWAVAYVDDRKAEHLAPTYDQAYQWAVKQVGGTLEDTHEIVEEV